MKLPKVFKTKQLILIVIALISWQIFGACPTSAVNDRERVLAHAPMQKISAVGYVTWWSHDAVGYHPAIWLKIENNSRLDLSKSIIRLQGRFTDLHSGYVTVARKEVHLDFMPHQRNCVMLRAPSSFELPIDENAWPTIECKVMCRVGDVGDEGTQDLVVAHLDQIAMTDEESLAHLIKQTGIR